MGAFDDLRAKLDSDDQRRRGRQFELICKWFLENHPTYQPLLRRVWMWDEWGGRKGSDSGIDLVAEDQDRKLWAIQAKAYDPAYSISKRDIDKFVAESSRKIFTHRLLIGTTEKRHHIAARLMDDLGIPFIGLTQLREADDYLDWPASPAALRPSKPPKPKKPYDYQQAAIRDVVKGFKTAERGQLIMACGTGKTLTAWFINEKLVAQRTLVLVPSLSLLKQTMREWQTANPKKPCATLPVCSDETVGSLGEDAAVSHISDLGVPVTTEPTEIARFLRKRSGPRIVFCTYQSSPQIAEALALARVPAFDLVIADEAHRVAGPVSSDFATVLDATAIKSKRRLFMTATPRFFTGRILREAKDADYEVASMDDHARFGKVLHRLSFGEAIERELLTDYQVAIIGVDDATYLDWAERGTLVTLDGKKHTDARRVAGQIGLAKAMKKFDLHRMITFHSRVKASRDFAASMPAVLDWMPTRQRPKGRLWSDYVSGEMSAGERSVLIQHLKRLEDGERGLLANARCLAEGVDVPALDGVAFIDPRRSEVDIVQAVGRAIRRSEDKTIGTIVLPVFIDTDEDPEVALDSSVFKPVWDVIKALRAHDTKLGEELDALRRAMGRKGGKLRLPGKIHVDVPAVVGREFGDAFTARLVDATTAPWEFWYGLLQDYVATNGTALVPAAMKWHGENLGVWVNKQRTLYAQDKLPLDRRERLEEIPTWIWDAVEAAWTEGFSYLVDYAEANGSASVAAKKTWKGFRLGQWVFVQRQTYRRLGRDRFDAPRRDRLEALAGWAWNARDARWESNFQKLSAYAAKHRSMPTDPKLVIDGFRVVVWVKKQRALIGRDKLNPARKKRLEHLRGWVSTPSEYLDWVADDGSPRRVRLSEWNVGFDYLEKYAKTHRTATVPITHREGTFRLGDWAADQRASYAAGRLPPELIKRLEALPGWCWNLLDAKWEEAFRRLLEYVKGEGDALVKPTYRDPDGYRLGGWVSKQRVDYRDKKPSLTKERISRLEVLPGWSWLGPRG